MNFKTNYIVFLPRKGATMNNKIKKQIKSLVSQAMKARGEVVEHITKSRVKDIIREEVASHYGSNR